jgi:hypothetical protein
MDSSRPLSITLFIYECMRLVFLTGVFMVLQPESETPFPWLALITPGALFFLMALFWLLDDTRYRLYYPLYLAGKGCGIVTFMFWIIFAGNDIIREMLYGKLARYIAPGAVFFLLLGDALSVWTVIIIMRGNKDSDNKEEDS